MPFGGSGTQAGAPWRASVVRTEAEGGDTLPRVEGTWVAILKQYIYEIYAFN